jgi:hypothetical protein
MTSQRKTTGNLKDNAPDGFELSESEQAEARKEGAKEAAKEAAADTYKYLTDGNLPGDPPARSYAGADDIAQFAPLLGLGVDTLKDLVSEKADDPIPEEKVVGLLRLERNGQNRTTHVKLLMDRLGIKTKEELYAVSPGGPDYTNDTSAISQL